MDERIRVLVADDHTLFRDGLVALLEDDPHTEVVGDARTGLEAVQQAHTTSPTIILMDIMMPEMNGIEATRRIRSELPDIHIVMLTMLEDDDSLFAAMCAGARGYILKGADKEDVLRTVQSVAKGEALFGPAMARRLSSFFQHADRRGMSMAPFPELTDREREVLDRLAAGHDNTRIAHDLFISTKTVSNHISNIFTKLEVTNRAQAIVTARDRGLGQGDRIA